MFLPPNFLVDVWRDAVFVLVNYVLYGCTLIGAPVFNVSGTVLLLL